MNVTPDNVKDIELDINKALKVMLNGVTSVQSKGKYSFEESFFLAQALYGIQKQADTQLQTNETPESSDKTTDNETKEKVMRVTCPEGFTMDDYIQVIVQGLELGQRRGAFNFAESALIGRAIEVFKKFQHSTGQHPTEQHPTEQEATEEQPQTVVL